MTTSISAGRQPIVKPVSEMTREDVLHNLRVVLEMMEDGRITDEQFDMGEPNLCDSACCIGGWIAEVSGDPMVNIDKLSKLADGPEARGPMCDLFYNWTPSDMFALEIRPRHVIPVIRHYLETGVTDWTLAREEPRSDLHNKEGPWSGGFAENH